VCQDKPGEKVEDMEFQR